VNAFLTAAFCPKRDFYTHTHLENATDFCTALCLLVLGHKEAKLHVVLHTKKNSICTAKILIIHTFSGFGTFGSFLNI